MKKYFTRFVAVAFCLVASLSAHAQFRATIEQYVKGYSVDYAKFSLTDVAAALETDAETLGSALAEWLEGGSTDYFFLNADGELSNNYTQGGKGGFWMTANPAVPTGWTGEVGDDVWYNVFSVDEEYINIGIGQHPDAFEGGESLSAQFVLVFGEKQATFDITLNILTVDLPTPFTTVATLADHIVGEQTVKSVQPLRASTDGSKVEVDAADLIDKLGVDPSLFENVVGMMAYAKVVVASGEDHSIQDELTNNATEGDGWWFIQATDKEQNNLAGEFAAGNITEGLFYVNGFSFNAADNILTATIGQSGSLNVDDDMTADIYFIYGEKVYVIHFNLVVVEPTVIPIDPANEVGSQDIVIEQYPNNDYSTSSIEVDIVAVADALGVAVADVKFWAKDENGGFTDASSGERGGYWVNRDGVVVKWGQSSVVCVNPNTAGDFSKYALCQYPGAFAVGESMTYQLYLTDGGEKYYTLNITLNVIEKPAPTLEFVSVATRAVNIQTVPAGVYPIDMTYDIDFDELESLIGTRSPKLYAREAPANEEESWTGRYSDAYSCDPKPGFWMSADGYASVWGSTPWGFSYQEAEMNFIFFQLPNNSHVGDVYKAPIYLVNETTGKMITYNFTISFVETVIPEAQIVGRESLVLPVTLTENDYEDTPVDMTACLEALGVESVGNLLAEQSLAILDQDGNFSSIVKPSESFELDANGCLDTEEGRPNAKLSIVLEDEDDTVANFSVTNMHFLEGDKVMATFGFTYGEKRYVFNITFVDANAFVGIGDVKKNAATAPVFDLAGRRVAVPAQRGIYLRDGKKVAVK
ncbi:MAG: DUF4859 domain-containing protein [Bacteroidaceae bacterium]|nr:DUF4859 domain-containing protein [Bacteroidaceae bacterium]